MKRKENDWMGLWYQILRERGDNDKPSFGVLNLKTNQVNWRHFSHQDMDGIGALIKYYDEIGYNLTNLPSLREEKLPDFFERIIIFLKALSAPRKIKCVWNFFDPTLQPKDPLEFKWHIFTPEESEKIKAHTKKIKCSENAFLLNLASHYLLSKLTQNQSGTWTVPVNLRPVLKRDDIKSNHSSGLLIPIDAKDSPHITHDKIKAAFKRKEHWAVWWIHQIGKFIGYKGMQYISKKNSSKNFWAGSFSNLGSYTLPKDDIWIGCPPGSKNFPIGLYAMRCNDRLNLCLKIHPSIMPDQTLTAAYLEGVVKSILEQT